MRYIIEDRRFYDDVDAMYAYLRPIQVSLDSLQGNGTNLTDAIVLFEELQDYFNDDNKIWNIFNTKWELCESDLWPASVCVDLRYNENFNNIEKDPHYEEYKSYNPNSNNNNNNSNNHNNNETRSIFDTIVTSFRSNINGRNVQRSIDTYLVKIRNDNNNNNKNNNIFNNRRNRPSNVENRIDLVANGTFCKAFSKPEYLQHRLDATAMRAGEEGLKKAVQRII